MVKTATLVAAAALVVAGVGVVQAAGRGDAPAAATASDRQERAGTTSTSAREVAEDVRGPCDEAEHAADPRCGNSAPAAEGGSGTGEQVDDGRRNRGRRSSGRGDDDGALEARVDDRGGGDGDRGRSDDDNHDENDDDNRSGSNSGRS